MNQQQIKDRLAQLFVEVQCAVMAEERVNRGHSRGENHHDEEEVCADEAGHDSDAVGQGHNIEEVLCAAIDEEERNGNSRRNGNKRFGEVFRGPAPFRASHKFALSCGHGSRQR